MDQQQTLIIDQIVEDRLVMVVVLRKKELEDLVALGVNLIHLIEYLF
jgi:hypothetical protein